MTPIERSPHGPATTRPGTPTVPFAAAPLQVALRDDNDDKTLPAHWRGWWQARFDDVSVDQPTRVLITRLAWPQAQLPMMSYDAQHWQRVPESGVGRPHATLMTLDLTFSKRPVFLAPFEPYPVERLRAWVQSLLPHPCVQHTVIGQSQQGRPIDVLTLAGPQPSRRPRQAVWIHARTHPGEVGSSFVAEGIAAFFLGQSSLAISARRHFVFHLLPMLNPDGVAAENYRTTPRSENLEVKWWRLGDSDAQRSPQEIRVAQRHLLNLDREQPFCAALNLHATHAEPDALPHLVRHFGPTSEGFATEEADLWHQQQELLEAINDVGPLAVNQQPSVGSRRFLDLPFPETFWWRHAKNRVAASTFETVYGRVGKDGGWITADEQRTLGQMLAAGLVRQRLARLLEKPPHAEREHTT